MLSIRSLRVLSCSFPMALLLAGCADANVSTPGTPVVSISGASTIRLNASTQLTATVSNTSNTAVTWQVNGVTGGTAATGTITTTGIYTAPSVLPASPYTVTITATSAAKTSVTASLVENIENPLPVTSNGTATEQSISLTYTLDITGSGFVPTSTLQVNGTTQTTTFVSASELKTAITVPSGTTTVAVTTTNPNPGGSTSSAINIAIPAPVSISISGPSTTRLNGVAQMTATVANTPNQNVTWQVNGVTGGSSTSGTISIAGLYTAPAVLPASPYTVNISAISQAIPTAVANFPETLENPLPSATSGTATESGTTLVYQLDVIGTGFVPSSVLNVNSISQTTTYISPTELQATFTASVGAVSVPVFVSNPNPGAASSNTITITLPTAISATAAARILDQTTFGATAAEIQSVQQIGINNYLAQQFARHTYTQRSASRHRAHAVPQQQPALRPIRVLGRRHQRPRSAPSACRLRHVRDVRRRYAFHQRLHHPALPKCPHQ